VLVGRATPGTAVLDTGLDTVFDGTVVVVPDVLVAMSGGSVDAGAGTGEAGFCHTEGDVAAPRLGKRLSRIAYTAPAAPTSITAASATATVIGPPERGTRERGVGAGVAPTSAGVRENTVDNRDASGPCPVSSQSSLTTPVCASRWPRAMRPWS
jgi:hypothetical protein